MKKLILPSVFIVLFLAIGAVQTATAQRKGNTPKPKISEPRTVKDFYLLLPEKYFPFFDRVKNRRDLIESENLENGYLNFVGNRPFMPLENEMLLLRRTSGSPLLVIAYTDCDMGCEAVLRFVEYENGRWNEVEAAPHFDLAKMREIFRRKTGQAAEEKPKIIYSLSPVDKSITLSIAVDTNIEIYKLKWDGHFYNFAAQGK